MRPLVLWGGTGQAIVLDEFVSQLGYVVTAIIDNDKGLSSPISGVPVFNDIDELSGFLEKEAIEDARFAIAIGGSRGEDRCKLSAALKNIGLEPLTAIHPRAYVSDTSLIGEGGQVMASATVGARTVLGNYVIINTGAVVDHECRLGHGVHIGPGVTLAGLVEVGDYAFIGTGAVVLPRVRIGKNSIVGAGSIVTGDIPENVVCMGAPARITKINGSQ
jgi:sugar O-acyltransferase (sialic acid O-acetyltransferase NeuD family)